MHRLTVLIKQESPEVAKMNKISTQERFALQQFTTSNGKRTITNARKVKYIDLYYTNYTNRGKKTTSHEMVYLTHLSLEVQLAK